MGFGWEWFALDSWSMLSVFDESECRSVVPICWPRLTVDNGKSDFLNISRKSVSSLTLVVGRL